MYRTEQNSVLCFRSHVGIAVGGLVFTPIHTPTYTHHCTSYIHMCVNIYTHTHAHAHMVCVYMYVYMYEHLYTGTCVH